MRARVLYSRLMTGIVPWGYRGYNGLAPYRHEANLSLPTEPSLPAKESFRDWWKELRGSVQPPPPTHIESAIVGLRHNGESAAIAALLALIDTELGGLDLGGRIPLDWVGAAAFYAMSIQTAGKPDGLASDYRAMGQSCTSVAMYRMIHRWRESKKDIPQNTPQLSGDPVLVAAKSKF
jgi:hypothetical protein